MEPTPEQIAALRRLSDALNEVRTAENDIDELLAYDALDKAWNNVKEARND
jgi:hypothetical protein